ncbi:MAG: ribosomal protein type [Thermoleophilia bacterium]|nr:ribosomal protein type [Thermoleophilia bacterium]
MKSDLHPTYQPVVFRDRSGELEFLTRSTKTSDKTIEWEDGNTYPVIDVEISSASHPFYTGKQKLMDTGGRLGRFAAKLEAVGTEEVSSKKKKANVRTFTPAVDPKILAAKAARAEAKALEDAKKKKEAEEAEKVARAEAKAAKEQADAEAAEAAKNAPPEAEAAAEDAPADENAVATEAAVEASAGEGAAAEAVAESPVAEEAAAEATEGEATPEAEASPVAEDAAAEEAAGDA